jgi:hypothetical protein
MFRRLLLLALLLPPLALLASGCSAAGDKPVKVSGTVLLDGSPMPEGEISFITEGEPPAIGTIRNGAFEADVKPGKRRVEVRRWETVAAPKETTIKAEAPNRINKLPPRFNDASTLAAVVKAEGGNEFKFEVSSK